MEILSDDKARDTVQKFNVYHCNGVRWYWIIDPNALTVMEYQATPQGYLAVAAIDAGEAFRPQAFDGLTIHLAEMMGATPA